MCIGAIKIILAATRLHRASKFNLLQDKIELELKVDTISTQFV